ncbi:glycosyltransferase family 61 protein [Poseidonocella sedimentorum]|uniref:Glycosyltransferase 61 catalytic domain-containing protein n=1 Tax=Poseidonocella sedimentorum TaxID=871652 RepID=A0A1I6ERF7_9RHOB|nr:glycosyltransferase 61 family protein [Poseidonocella sedimentorum]SFR20359.1 Protein of unknown function [Poseidonocella sedimentorum]
MQELSPGIADIRNAHILQPPTIRRLNVVDGVGAPVVEGAISRLGFQHPSQMVDLAALPEVEPLAGTWLFAGDYWSHFGHFLFESLARLWALEHLDTALDGILYLPTKRQKFMEIREGGFQEDLLRRCGVEGAVKVLTGSVRVERLIVPRQGCGIGPLASGTPEFRRFIRDRLSAGITPGQADRLYLSREGYGLRRGGVFDEARLSELLEREGYLSFRPERVSIEEQIAAYLGASRIISPDSTALHLVAFLAREDQDVAVVLRRGNGAKDIGPNLAGFMGRRPAILDRITRQHVRDNIANKNWARYAELDMPALGADLVRHGFIDDARPWTNLDAGARAAVRDAYAEKLGCGFETVERDRGPGAATGARETAGGASG